MVVAEPGRPAVSGSLRRGRVLADWMAVWPDGSPDDSGYTLDDAAGDDDVRVSREAVVEALAGWMESTGASQLGQTFGVSQKDGRERFAAYLIDGVGRAGGPVRAVLTEVGYEIVDGA